jgi:hypothetical protein
MFFYFNNTTYLYHKKGTIMEAKQSYSILPFIPAGVEMGMGKYGHVLYEGVTQEDAPICVYAMGVRTYITGLNEDGPEVTSLPEEDRQKKRLEIRMFIARCENELTANYDVSPNDVEDKQAFYKNVKTFKSVIPIIKEDNKVVPAFWDSLSVQLTNSGSAYISTNLRDRLIAYVAAAGGYSMVAPSLAAAQASGKQAFYFDAEDDSSKDRVSLSRERNKAGALLETMLDKNPNKLFYVTKLISTNPLHWKTGKNGTPANVQYEHCEKFLNGEGKLKNKGEAISRFMTLASTKKDMDDLRIECYIEDGLKLGQLQVQTDGSIIHVPTQTPLGKGKDNLFAFLKAGGESEPVYKALSAAIEKEWKED